VADLAALVALSAGRTSARVSSGSGSSVRAVAGLSRRNKPIENGDRQGQKVEVTHDVAFLAALVAGLGFCGGGAVTGDVAFLSA
jgi:hypothetical protein